MSELSDLEELETDFKVRSPYRTRKQLKRDKKNVLAAWQHALTQRNKKRRLGPSNQKTISLAPVVLPNEEASR